MKHQRLIGIALPAGVALGILLQSAAGASDSSAAANLVVKPGDVGPGYTAAQASKTPDVFPQIAQCVGKPVPNRKVAATVNGPELTNSTAGVTIDSTVDVVKTKAMVKADIAVFSDPAFPHCVERLSATQGLTALAVPYGYKLKHYGDFTGAIGASIPSAQGGNIVEVGIAKGRAELDVSFIGPRTGEASFTPSITAVLDKLNARLKKANV